MLNASNFGWVAAFILSRKKRPKRRRLEQEPTRPRREVSAPAGFAGWAVADPALPLNRRGRQRAPPASPGGVSGPRDEQPSRRGAGRKGRRRAAHGLQPRPAASPLLRAPRPPLPLPENRPEARPGQRGRRAPGRERWGVATGRTVRGLRVPPRHVAAPGALPPRALRAVGAAPRPNKAETPRRK